MKSMDIPSTPSPNSSPNPGDLLRRRIISWSRDHCTPASVHVHVDGKIFHLHEVPLATKSGFFKKALLSSAKIELPETFPGGSQAFEMAMLFIYGSPIPLDPFNVLALRCAGGFLEMTEDFFTGNLCEQSDLYLNQVVFQSWDDTIIVLQKCQALLSWSDELLVTSRCIESLAFMACMEILDPERRRTLPHLNLQAMVGRAWSCETVKQIPEQDSWVKELIALPFEFFDRIISSLRKQGMKEKYVSPLIVFYANKWVLSKEEAGDNNVSAILAGLIRLLPPGEKRSRVIPAGFYFAMISSSMTLGLEYESWASLEEQASSLLQFAQAEDFLQPATGVGLKVMLRIFSLSLPSQNPKLSLMNAESTVAELWDRYLSSIAIDPELDSERFMDLIETVPMAARDTHDHLYRAITVFLLEHPNVSTESKEAVCKRLNCQKLSQPVCIQAVQNELLPLGIIVKALSVQQLYTHQTLRGISESFRYSQFVDFSGSLMSSISPAPLNSGPGESPSQLTTEEEDNRGSRVEKNPKLEEGEFESTSFRIQLLEKELVALKISLKQQCLNRDLNQIESKVPRLRHVRGCVGSIGWGSKRKYVSRLVKAFGRLKMVGKRKNKIRVEGSSLVDCKRRALNGDHLC